jgi:hypothetical protein
LLQRPRRTKACGAGTDDGDIDFGGGGHERAEWRMANGE